ncbi:hypothetical protein CEXT_306861, partial [Caerostris extrusa]
DDTSTFESSLIDPFLSKKGELAAFLDTQTERDAKCTQDFISTRSRILLHVSGVQIPVPHRLPHLSAFFEHRFEPSGPDDMEQNGCSFWIQDILVCHCIRT